MASARAMAARWSWPPDSWRGRRRANAVGSRTWSSSSATAVTFGASEFGVDGEGLPTLAPMVASGSKEEYGSWKTSCILRRRVRRRAP